jgi:hypothetical protein
MERIDQLRFETKVMDLLWNEYTKCDGDFDMEYFMDCLHQYVENAAQDFAMDNKIEYTPVY